MNTTPKLDATRLEFAGEVQQLHTRLKRIIAAQLADWRARGLDDIGTEAVMTTLAATTGGAIIAEVIRKRGDCPAAFCVHITPLLIETMINTAFVELGLPPNAVARTFTSIADPATVLADGVPSKPH